MLDSDIRHLLDTVFKASPGTAEPDVAALRKAAEEAPKLLGGVPETLASVSDASAFGEPCAVALRVYRPESASALPLLLYAHGGGWVTGSLDSHDRLCRMLANTPRRWTTSKPLGTGPAHTRLSLAPTACALSSQVTAREATLPPR